MARRVGVMARGRYNDHGGKYNGQRVGIMARV